MDLTSAKAWMTVVMLVVFIGIVIWAYSSKRKKQFDEAARSVLEDDAPEGSEKRGQGRKA
ncbi:MAG TPA: cbb3-type cytochrome c oxidase subunit 3 [Burkholderiales bacterium]|nr:cbb3-type cytochrome c oxidase subunit 3 [Burkholderiales bacterium]